MTAIINPSARDLITCYGDNLEKEMFADGRFANFFNQYAELWADYILPNRKKGSLFVSEYWSKLGEHSYTAVIRCWNAFEAKKSIVNICTNIIENPSASILLTLHGELSKFFWSAGAAIDNLDFAFNSGPVELGVDTLKVNKEVIGSLGWFYDRRTQYMHKITIPLQIINDLAFINPANYTSKNVSWQNIDDVNLKEVSQMVKELWGHFHKNMDSAWARLYSSIRSNHPTVERAKLLISTKVIGVSGWHS